ncbi:unnamed protein product [Echinostoma caproni]|uniref:F-box domain-containing protein n=1 Tax=Echinostoma caproni TaxID=27848 RepID=A0A183B6P1_9TREM|nr:unnamed protein product [Echinostoma caproni]
MPSRVEVHSGRHDASTNYSSQKPVSYTVSKQLHEASGRSRQKRMRFTSGGAIDDNVSTSEDATAPRIRRHATSNATRIPKGQGKLSNSQSSSPTSPCGVTDQMDRVHSRGTVVLDTAIGGVEHMEDDNSFSSSVFSEHLVQPELQMVISTAPDNPVDKGRSRRSSILSAENLILTDSENKEADVLVKDMKSMENLLIHTDSGISTPTLQTADDAGSSEGEDENDGKDEVLMSASDNIHLSSSRPSDNDLPSVSQPPIVDEHCGPPDNRFSDTDLAILKGGSFSHILPVEDKCEFVHETTSPPTRSCILPDANPNGVVSPKAPNCHFDAKDIDPDSLPGLPSVLETHPTCLSARVMTRSQTAELSKQPCSPIHCSNSRRDSKYLESSSPLPSNVSSSQARFRNPAKCLDKRRSSARGMPVSSHGSNEDVGSCESTSLSSLSNINSASAACPSSGITCASPSPSEGTPDVTNITGKSKYT